MRKVRGSPVLFFFLQWQSASAANTTTHRNQARSPLLPHLLRYTFLGGVYFFVILKEAMLRAHHISSLPATCHQSDDHLRCSGTTISVDLTLDFGYAQRFPHIMCLECCGWLLYFLSVFTNTFGREVWLRRTQRALPITSKRNHLYIISVCFPYEISFQVTCIIFPDL